MGYPKRVRLLINPEKKELAIQPCNDYETLSFKVPSDFLDDKHGFELSSQKLISLIYQTMCWQKDKSYRVYGSYNPKENIVVFQLNVFSINQNIH